jgi:cyclopropane fatty-acyl-phospholipid synthase-like methyltransferase
MAKSAVIYNKGFFERTQPASRRSAGVIVPIVMGLIRPAAVVDVGCGTGEFLRIFQDQGVQEILGIDGMYVDRSQLAISQECFRAVDLSKPFTLDKTYDMAVSLEVAEHLDPERASDFIKSLTQLAPVVLFSAAIPLQNGYHHVNEQWPEYWAQLFQTRGFQPVDAIRKRIWHNRRVEDYYRQNIFLFCTEQFLKSSETLEKEFRETNRDMLSLVHPDLFLRKRDTGAIRMMQPVKDTVRKILRK